jgi:hypothetical protein
MKLFTVSRQKINWNRLLCVCKRIFFGEDGLRYINIILVDLANFGSGWLTSHSIEIFTYTYKYTS